MTLLEVRDLRTWFEGDAGTIRAVDGVSFSVAEGEVVGLVGESGCGKTVTALSVLGLVPQPPGQILGIRPEAVAAGSATAQPALRRQAAILALVAGGDELRRPEPPGVAESGGWRLAHAATGQPLGGQRCGAHG